MSRSKLVTSDWWGRCLRMMTITSCKSIAKSHLPGEGEGWRDWIYIYNWRVCLHVVLICREGIRRALNNLVGFVCMQWQARTQDSDWIWMRSLFVALDLIKWTVHDPHVIFSLVGCLFTGILFYWPNFCMVFFSYIGVPQRAWRHARFLMQQTHGCLVWHCGKCLPMVRSHGWV